MTIGDALEAFPGAAPLPPFDGAFGAGRFGRWVIDEAGRPAFDYAPEPGVEGDHWHLIGNDRFSATAHSGGYVQVWDWTRGGRILTRWHPPAHHYGAGFHWIVLGDAVLCTLHGCLPPDAAQTRRFGQGYFEKRTQWRGIEISERIEIPPGDGCALHIALEVRNAAARPLRVEAVACACVNLHTITVAPIMTYGTHRLYDAWRMRLNRRYTLHADCDPAASRVCVRFSPRRPPRKPREAPAIVDAYPPGLAFGAVPAEGPVACFAPGAAWWGSGGPAAPAGLRAEGFASPAARNALEGAPLLLCWPIDLAPGETARRTSRLEYVHGGVSIAAPPADNAPARADFDFRVPEAPEVTRELDWHAYYLQAGSYYSEYFDAHFVDQGSAYGYMQGASGAPRDFALFLLPLVYLRPALAKDMLRFVLRLQRARDGAFPYAVFGHGACSGGGVHSWSSDLDLFVLWALGEYLGATRDRGFLDESIEYYPRSAARRGSVLEHAQRSFAHLVEKVGLGPHGMLRAGTGDWNDVLLAFSRLPPVTAWRGESALNAGLAAVALPLLADAVASDALAFAEALSACARRQVAALEALWTGEWLARGYLGYGRARLGAERIFLDAQSFPVIGGVWDAARARALYETIHARCSAPQRAGAMCLVPPMRGPLLHPGSDTNGGTWAAIDAWTAWGWSMADPRGAWDFFRSTLLAARAEAYPAVWYGVWSGPDSYNAHHHPRPGETFDFNATPMAKFPVMNMNRHAGPLLAAIKMAGIGPHGGAMRFAPRLPFDAIVCRTPLCGMAAGAGERRGYYVPVCDGPFEFAVAPPAGIDAARCAVWVHGERIDATCDAEGLLRFAAAGRAGQRIDWRAAAYL